jgi:hypothetical protein
MGAESFYTEAKGKTAKDAFRVAVEEAAYYHGHGGYTGTIAEKSSFEEIRVPDDKDPEDYARELMDACDPRVDDKWGPAGCVKLKPGEYLFFGWASS